MDTIITNQALVWLRESKKDMQLLWYRMAKVLREEEALLADLVYRLEHIGMCC